MMGEFIIYYRGKIVGGIYDDRLLVKPTKSAISYMPTVTYEIIPNTPYTPIKNIILHFEKYDYRFHWNRDNSVIEIWIPIQD